MLIKSMNPKYRSQLEAMQMFRQTFNDEDPPAQKCRKFLEESFDSEKEDFKKGQFFGASVVDELDAKDSIVQIFSNFLTPDNLNLLSTILHAETLDKKKFSSLHAMLAGYISSLIK